MLIVINIIQYCLLKIKTLKLFFVVINLTKEASMKISLKKSILCVVATLVTCSTLHAGSIDNFKPESIFSIDFRKPEYKTSKPCAFAYDQGTEFNPACGRSWKLDRYNAKTGEFSFIEIDVELSKNSTQSYVLELLQCARKDAPQLANMSIQVNDKVVVQGFHPYNGPDNPHYPNESGKPWHLRWDVFEITNELKEGMNKIRISLDDDTQSGISISLLHIRPGQL